MKIIGVDPGYQRMGVAVIETGSRNTLLYSGCITTDKKDCPSKRLKIIGGLFCGLIEQYKPEVLSIENIFFNTNQKTAIMVAAARGVAIYEAAKHMLPVYEYSPLQIKIALTSYGRADKRQVRAMVEKMISLDKKIRFDDEYDAIATALTHSAMRNNLSTR